MPLSVGVLAWLQTNVDPAASAREFEDAYDATRLRHAFNSNRQHYEDIEAVDRLYWSINFFDSKGQPVTDPQVSRRLYLRAALFDDDVETEGRVAINEVCFVRPAYKKQKFATRLYEAEEVLYRKWKVREIQINAIDEGVIVWPRLGFALREFNLVAVDYQHWARSQAGVPPVLPRDPKQYPTAFLDLLRQKGKRLDLFKVLK